MNQTQIVKQLANEEHVWMIQTRGTILSADNPIFLEDNTKYNT